MVSSAWSGQESRRGWGVFRVFWPILDGCGKPPAGIELSRWKEMTWKNVGSECVRSLLMRCEVLVSAAERLPHLSLVAAL